MGVRGAALRDHTRVITIGTQLATLAIHVGVEVGGSAMIKLQKEMVIYDISTSLSLLSLFS